MRFGAHTFGFVWQADSEAAVSALAEAGFRQVQLMATPPHFDPWAEDASRTRRLRAILERYDMTLLAADLASSDVNLASASRDVVAFSVDAYRRLIARCAELSARWVCVGSGRRHPLLDGANARLMESFRPAFAAIVEEGAKRGVRIILENHPLGLLAEAEAMAGFLESQGYDDVQVIYDVANAAAVGEDVAGGIARLGNRIGIVHLSDSPPGAWRHDRIGSGAIDFSAVGTALTKAGFTGPVVLEILSEDALGDLLDGAERLEAQGFQHDKRSAA